jgi:hypothetical protein
VCNNQNIQPTQTKSAIWLNPAKLIKITESCFWTLHTVRKMRNFWFFTKINRSKKFQDKKWTVPMYFANGSMIRNERCLCVSQMVPHIHSSRQTEFRCNGKTAWEETSYYVISLTCSTIILMEHIKTSSHNSRKMKTVPIWRGLTRQMS